ncbi:MAG TPA: GAF domain-containing sensor histidine kinase [Magnetospirillaceae bacterium]|nr:GAF domain-containing sensor histidine kinase [Magnetospirillaceae bacterium]
MQARAKELRILYAIADELNGATDAGRALERVLAIVTQALGLRAGWIWLVDPTTQRFYLAASHDLPPYLREPVRMSGSWCQCTQAFRDGALSAKNVDVIECSRLAPAVASKSTALTGGLRYHASVPLYFRDKPLGIMNLTAPKFRKLSSGELRLLATIALQASATVERARLAAEGARLARVEERTRLAREIHDTLAQRLTAIALQLEGALKHLDGSSERARLELARALDMAREGLTEAQGSMRSLRGAPPIGNPLPQALAALARAFTSRTGIQVQVDAAPLELSANVETELLAIAKEALTNVGKHARATAVAIRLSPRGRRVELTIHDDGVGYRRSRTARGQGIIGMGERSQLVGGTLRVKRARSGGTTVTVALPMAESRG